MFEQIGQGGLEIEMYLKVHKDTAMQAAERTSFDRSSTKKIDCYALLLWINSPSVSRKDVCIGYTRPWWDHG
jgi:hypothetical protein